MIYMFLSNNPSSGDINSSNLSCFAKNLKGFTSKTRPNYVNWPMILDKWREVGAGGS